MDKEINKLWCCDHLFAATLKLCVYFLELQFYSVYRRYFYLINYSRELLKAYVHISNLANQTRKRIPQLMRHCSINERKKYLLCLTFIIQNFVRHINDLQHFLGSILIVFFYNAYFEWHIFEFDGFLSFSCTFF